RTGEVGNLLVRGDSACSAYWNQHELTKQTIVGEWLRTGDKYRRDADGYSWYAGRADDMIKAGGIWVSPAEVESALAEHPAVVEAGVVGASDQDDRRALGQGALHLRAPSGRGGGRRRRVRPGRARQTARIRRARPRPAADSGAGRRAPGLREESARALQVSALDRVRSGATEDGDGEDPTLQVTGAGKSARASVTVYRITSSDTS